MLTWNKSIFNGSPVHQERLIFSVSPLRPFSEMVVIPPLYTLTVSTNEWIRVDLAHSELHDKLYMKRKRSCLLHRFASNLSDHWGTGT